MISAASDGVKVMATLAVAFVFATKGLRNLDLVGIIGTDPILVHPIEVSEGIRRANDSGGASGERSNRDNECNISVLLYSFMI